MQRFKQPNMDLHPDGEWIRYDDHVDAMKRIAGAPVAEGLTDERRDFDELAREARREWLESEASMVEIVAKYLRYVATPAPSASAPKDCHDDDDLHN